MSDIKSTMSESEAIHLLRSFSQQVVRDREKISKKQLALAASILSKLTNRPKISFSNDTLEFVCGA